MSRTQVAKGKAGQEVAGWALQRAGVLCLERIETGWRVHRQGARIVGATPLRTVSGDWRGVLRGGRSVLVEVKAVPVLSHGELDDHQHRALADHHQAGGLAVVAWVHATGAEAWLLHYVHLLGAGWRSGAPLHPENQMVQAARNRAGMEFATALARPWASG
jgi:hypothetical protein